MHALFICSRNRLRSPTAECVFAQWPNVETDSAGLAPDADVPLTADQLEWAEVIFVMERAHRRRLAQRFGPWLRGKRVVCLGIPDDYAFMQPELVALLERRAGPYLRS
ncbi:MULTISPECIES: low molecular weight protein tyrosine phosphatase family protein [Ralstonia solanacearum species complex]|uniref:low molecular weight protein tyrosine phosphatase family protein n=1 Tax=Ralstonia solanacearum species complex TaxID=3116862 RepID=UPI000E58615A|nr:low molecular weight protein tyrosine phosphatase family protein [Ralstonia solanacearum]BEU73638.1 low molecular weight protein tyrosine phosphatase family protein [Ralstonia pseudosolanacearum]AXV78409.1 phosphotyrosine protein phosphatase [Ralstonia solanacearum]AXV92433.1 phosphotyrosine protein phosphatase [Ralstonia solanacearum]AXW20486.1 phosphotyrosine protein phosphatase [Ralstonia solanacearum]AXW77320.1 phosphotyrosine protein phosphatase [Ralstonia solanacearum]